MPKYEESIGKLIRRARKATQLTQAKLGELTGLSSKYVQLLESGKRNPSLKSLRKIAKHLKISLKELLPDRP